MLDARWSFEPEREIAACRGAVEITRTSWGLNQLESRLPRQLSPTSSPAPSGGRSDRADTWGPAVEGRAITYAQRVVDAVFRDTNRSVRRTRAWWDVRFTEVGSGCRARPSVDRCRWTGRLSEMQGVG